MEKNIKAVSYKAIHYHPAETYPNEPWLDEPEYQTEEIRYRIISTETGEILDDAQGYGYKTAKKAYAAYAYKHRDKSKDNENAAKRKHIQQWMKKHKSFVELMDDTALDIAKGSWGPDDKFDTKTVSELLKENNLQPDFSAYELLKEWRKR